MKERRGMKSRFQPKIKYRALDNKNTTEIPEES